MCLVGCVGNSTTREAEERETAPKAERERELAENGAFSIEDHGKIPLGIITEFVAMVDEVASQVLPSQTQSQLTQDIKAVLEVFAERSPERKTVAAQERSNPVDLHNTGISFFDRKDYLEAVKWFKEAAEQGAVPSFLYVGVCYGQLGNMQEATRWFKRGAEAGCDRSQYMHGLRLLNLGIERNAAETMIEGRMWMQRSAQQGNQDAIKLARELERAENTPIGIAFALRRAGLIE